MEPDQPQGGLQRRVRLGGAGAARRWSRSMTSDTGLRVTPLQYTIQRGEQTDAVDRRRPRRAATAFRIWQRPRSNTSSSSVHSAVKYDLLGKMAEGTQLTRRTVAEILKGINVGRVRPVQAQPGEFHHRGDPAHQRAEGHRDRRAPGLRRGRGTLRHWTSSRQDRPKQDFSKAGDKLKRHIYDYVVTDSKIEREFVTELDTSTRGRRLREAATRLPHPDAGRRLQPRLGHCLQGGQRSSTSTSSPKPRAPCRRWNCERSRRPRSSAPASSSTR